MIYRLDGTQDPREVDLLNYYYSIVLFTKGKCRNFRFVWMVIAYLREHAELCEDPDYQKLYDECIYYLSLEWEIEKRGKIEKGPREELKKHIELIADLEYQEGSVFTKATWADVAAFFAYRKYLWEQEEQLIF